MSRRLAVPPALGALRFWLLAAAFALAAATLLLPRVTLTRKAYDAMAFVDVTASMNTRDAVVRGRPASRMDLVKDRLTALVAQLPCQSKLGLGIFTARRVFVLFEPIEVCENFSSIDSAIRALDWRMAWEGDSYVTLGIHDALAVVKPLDATLLFFTDGHEAPPLPWTGLPAFEGEAGEVPGLLVASAGKTLVPLPKFDDAGREIGTMSATDVLQENRSGAPPPDASSRPGWHPKWAPFGDMLVDNSEHMTSVKEDHLKEIATQTGLTYAHLQSSGALLRDLTAVAQPRDVRVAADIRPYPAGLAFLLLIVLYGVLPLRERIGRRRHQPKPALKEVLP
ncbi:vWA domain-containing protein [Methyloceanibacter methanicus]|uniref:vWA domain-containing protein n=1 Tax=Methyloceanibacter methanicus TaxID=1774968 RepID=UPI0008497075|nr:VWA domain-containing protein [Methyloceanibacter methanicus]